MIVKEQSRAIDFPTMGC